MQNTQHELIPITKMGDSQQWVDARYLHKFLESKQEFANWIKARIQDFGFIEGMDFLINLSKSTGGRKAIDYTITLDMAKELSMLERNEKGKQARQYFIAAEKQLRSLQSSLLSGYDEMQQLLQHCRTQMHNGAIYYAASQLRSLSGKPRNGGTTVMFKQLQQQGLAAKLPEGLTLKWYVHHHAVNRLLNVRPANMLSVAIAKLISLNN